MEQLIDLYSLVYDMTLLVDIEGELGFNVCKDIQVWGLLFSIDSKKDRTCF